MAEHDEGDSNQKHLMDHLENVDLSEKSDEFKKLVEYGLNPKVVTKLEEIFKTGIHFLILFFYCCNGTTLVLLLKMKKKKSF